MKLEKLNERVIESRQTRGVSLVIRETEYRKICENSGLDRGYMTLYVVGQDLPVRKDIDVTHNLETARTMLACAASWVECGHCKHF